MSLDDHMNELYKEIALLRSEILKSEENETPASTKFLRQLNETSRNLKSDIDNLNHVYRNLNDSLVELSHRSLCENLVVGSSATEFVEVKKKIEGCRLNDDEKTTDETKFPDLQKNLDKMEMLHFKADRNLQNLLNVQHLKPDISAEEGEHSEDMDETSVSSIGKSSLFLNVITSSPLS